MRETVLLFNIKDKKRAQEQKQAADKKAAECKSAPVSAQFNVKIDGVVRKVSVESVK